MTYKRKLIEVALPLEAINRESAREKSIRHGHPSTLHLWWARRPLAACRAVLFASLVDDPSARPDEFPTEADQEVERKRLFEIIEELVKWENTNNGDVLAAARAEIMKSCDGSPPPVLDPFCGGGSIPLEAQRLGLEAHASDLNPVAVLITKALIEIPLKFAGLPPIHPGDGAAKELGSWKGAQGLAEDVRYYGKWMRDEAERRIGHLYPKVKLPAEHGGGEATVIAWLWARTVTCPNPACGARMPLVRSFALSTKKDKEAWVEPIADGSAKTVRFEARIRKGDVPEGTVSRRGATCVVCGSAVPLDHVRAEGRAGRIGAQLMAIVAEGQRARTYLSPDQVHERIAASAEPSGVPDADIPHNPRYLTTPNYGMTKFSDLFTRRQLAALTTFSDLVCEAREQIARDGGQEEYADAVSTYLAFAVDRLANELSSICTWDSNGTKQHVRATFARQAIPISWDFAEGNVFHSSTGSFTESLRRVAQCCDVSPSGMAGRASQLDASQAVNGVVDPLISTDPPYYDNVGYADLSDFFYVWLRRSMASVYPNLFSTLLTPKTNELVADGGFRRWPQGPARKPLMVSCSRGSCADGR